MKANKYITFKGICLGLLVLTSVNCIMLSFSILQFRGNYIFHFLFNSIFQLVSLAGFFYVDRFLENKTIKLLSKIIAGLYTVFYGGIFLTVAWSTFQFYDPDIFLWGGAFQLLILSLLLQVIFVVGILLIDGYLKNKTCRIGSIVVLSVCLVASWIRYAFIWKINRMDEDVLRQLYPEIYYESSLPFVFQLSIWMSMLLLLIVLINQVIKMNKNGRTR